jgi:hypothetical protein
LLIVLEAGNPGSRLWQIRFVVRVYFFMDRAFSLCPFLFQVFKTYTNPWGRETLEIPTQ